MQVMKNALFFVKNPRHYIFHSLYIYQHAVSRTAVKRQMSRELTRHPGNRKIF